MLVGAVGGRREKCKGFDTSSGSNVKYFLSRLMRNGTLAILKEETYLDLVGVYGGRKKFPAKKERVGVMAMAAVSPPKFLDSGT